MTQELILGVLLVGIVGLVWALTYAIIGDDQRAPDSHQDTGVHHPSNPRASDKTPVSYRIVA